MTCFRTSNGKTLHSQLSPRQYSRFFYEMNVNQQSYEVALHIAKTSEPRVSKQSKTVSSLFSPDAIKRLQAVRQKHNCSLKSAFKVLESKGKLNTIR